MGIATGEWRQSDVCGDSGDEFVRRVIESQPGRRVFAFEPSEASRGGCEEAMHEPRRYPGYREHAPPVAAEATTALMKLAESFSPRTEARRQSEGKVQMEKGRK